MSKANFTTAEWELIKDAPFWVNAALTANDSRIGFFSKRRESKALNEAIENYKTNNALLKDIIADKSDPSPAIKKAKKEDTEQALRQIASIVEQKLGKEDLEALSDFLLQVGRSVAAASREGGLGLTTTISDKEEAVLKQIATALKATDADEKARQAAEAKAREEAARKEAEKKAQQEKARKEAEAKAAPRFKEFIAEHTVVAGENLSFISEKYYGTQVNFRLIYEANKDVIGDNMNLIRPGLVLKIPKL